MKEIFKKILMAIGAMFLLMIAWIFVLLIYGMMAGELAIVWK